MEVPLIARAEHLAGHNLDYMYFQSPLRGDFEVGIRRPRLLLARYATGHRRWLGLADLRPEDLCPRHVSQRSPAPPSRSPVDEAPAP